MKSKAVVLLSGGVDSSTTLVIAKSDGYDVCALTFDYCQRHRVELESAKSVAASTGVERHLIIRFDMSGIGGSALTSPVEVPKHGSEAAIISSRSVPVTYVPARNTIFLSFALAWAEVLGAEYIYIGANAVDYSGYPDCRPEYLKAYETMANLATKASVEGEKKFQIRAPLISLPKSGIIRKGIELGLDYSLTWSCYDPQPVKKQTPEHRSENTEMTDERPGWRTGLRPCGSCESCLIRAKGFRDAGIADPILIDDNKER